MTHSITELQPEALSQALRSDAQLELAQSSQAAEPNAVCPEPPLPEPPPLDEPEDEPPPAGVQHGERHDMAKHVCNWLPAISASLLSPPP